MKFKFAIPALALAAAAGFTVPANAAIPVYAPVKTVNPASYSFAAASSGEVGFYWLGGINYSYSNSFAYSVNGGAFTTVMTNGTLPGTYFDLGDFVAGDSFVFRLTLTKPVSVAGQKLYSVPGMNANGGLQQVYSTSYSGGDFGIASGSYTYLAFEDILGHHNGVRRSDFDYNDAQYAFVNLTNVVPEPATWAMLIAGFGMVGFALRRRKSAISVVAA